VPDLCAVAPRHPLAIAPPRNPNWPRSPECKAGATEAELAVRKNWACLQTYGYPSLTGDAIDVHRSAVRADGFSLTVPSWALALLTERDCIRRKYGIRIDVVHIDGRYDNTR
jgi:hypothetical protein